VLRIKTKKERELINKRVEEIKNTLYGDQNGLVIDPIIERVAILELFMEGHLESHEIGDK